MSGQKPELADIVDFLMEKNPDDRCPSATELLRLLEALLNPRMTRLYFAANGVWIQMPIPQLK